MFYVSLASYSHGQNVKNAGKCGNKKISAVCRQHFFRKLFEKYIRGFQNQNPENWMAQSPAQGSCILACLYFCGDFLASKKA